MGFVPAVEYEERNIHKLLSYAILMLWLMTFVMSGIAFYMYMGAQEYVEKFYIRSLLLEQAKIFLVQAISGILWFIVTLYIFISTITVEKKEKYNILSGVMFLASGVVELIVAIYLLQVRSELIYIAQRLPILTLAELRTRLARIMKLTILLALVSSIAISISIGMAFIFIGLSIKKTVMSLEMEVRRLIDTLKIEHQYIYFAYATPTNMVAYGVRRMMDGLKKMRSGGTCLLYTSPSPRDRG